MMARGTVLLCAWVALLAGCWGCDRVVREVRSPDGHIVAFASESPDIDPPNQRLGLRRGKEVQYIKTLAPDNEACMAIIWRPDGTKVGFVIQSQDGIYIRLYAAQSGRLLARVDLAGTGKDVRRPVMSNEDTLAFDECVVGTPTCVGRTVRLDTSK